MDDKEINYNHFGAGKTVFELEDLCLQDGCIDEPTHEELDYDEDYIYFYDNLHNLKKALKNLGYL